MKKERETERERERERGWVNKDHKNMHLKRNNHALNKNVRLERLKT
jgi:hypothetical protein